MNLRFVVDYLIVRIARWGHYTSTACQHGLHERCRRTCKFCGSSCRCRCGHLAATVDVPVSASDR